MKFFEIFYEPNSKKLSMSKIMLVIVFLVMMTFMTIALVKFAMFNWEKISELKIPDMPSDLLTLFTILMGYALGSKVTRVFEGKKGKESVTINDGENNVSES